MQGVLVTLRPPRYWVTRLLVASWAACTALVVLLGWRDDGAVADWLARALIVSSAIAFADVLVNDWMPERYVLCTIYFRHIGYMAIAFMLVFMAWAVMVRDGRGISIHVLQFFVPAAWSVVVTFLDLFYRHGRWPQ